MTNEFHIVDLGTKHGNAMVEFLRRSKPHLGTADWCNSLLRKHSLGYEHPNHEDYREIVEGKGFQFRTADLSLPEVRESLPTAAVYLAWHFLEHLPSKEQAHEVVKAALRASTLFASFRLPSFQQDDKTGEGALKRHGMRFTWTNWEGHPTAWLVEDCLAAINDWKQESESRKHTVTVRPVDYIHNVNNYRVVPIGAPVDVQKYLPEYGPKPEGVVFDPPVVSSWEINVSMQ